jgi:hypothetical protein
MMVVNISKKKYKCSSMHIEDILQTKSGYFIICSDLDLAYIDQNYTAAVYDNDHLCYNPPKNDD